ncbi:MAG: hypothetical protein HQK50_17240 [Oligoflexia bacterium]|nr:hypothetical protein [Oligoflexia bacterium]
MQKFKTTKKTPTFLLTFFIWIFSSVIFQNNSYAWNAEGKGYNPPFLVRTHWDYNRTHAKMTEFALKMSDKFAMDFRAYRLLIANRGDIIAFSNAPDVDDIGGGLPYCRHFYNPQTHRPILPCDSNALEQFHHYINVAFEAAKNQQVAEYPLAKALHFLQDLSMPFHARNVMARPNPGDIFFSGIGHVGYENDARHKFQNQSLTDNFTEELPIPSGNLHNDINGIALELNQYGYDRFGAVINSDTRESATKELFAKTIMATAKVIYLFSYYLDGGSVMTGSDEGDYAAIIPIVTNFILN